MTCLLTRLGVRNGRFHLPENDYKREWRLVVVIEMSDQENGSGGKDTMKERVGNVADVLNCPKCGVVGSVQTYLGYNKYVCLECGVRWSIDGEGDYEYLEKPRQNIETVYVCESCGYNVKRDAVECPRCGSEFVD